MASILKRDIQYFSPRGVSRVACIALMLSAALLSYTGGATTVTTAGTPVQLSTSPQKATILTIQAKSTNTGTIWVGGTTVSASGKIGVALGPPTTAGQPGASVAFNPQGNAAVYTLSEFWLDATVSGEGVTYAWK